MYKATNIWSNIRLWPDEKRNPIEIDRDAQGNNKYFQTKKKNRSLIPSKLVEKIYNKIIQLQV